MRGFYLDANGDVEIRKNDIAVASGLELKMQKICQVLRTNCGEWWANPKEGIPMRQILKKNPDARIVMISSLAYEDTFERAKAIGAKGFVDKPFHQEQLLKVFQEALA